MEAVHKILEEANDALVKGVEGMDSKLRPVQRAFFACGFACTDDKRDAAQVGQCIQACQAPLQNVQELLHTAQESFQDRIRRCHQVAGETLNPNGPASQGRPSDAEMAAYAASLRPCVQGEVANVSQLLQPVFSAVPKAQADIKAATPAGGPQLEGKKGWW